MPLYPHPLSPGYWRSAAGELKALRRLVFMALMIAACIVLSHCSIRLGESLSLSVTFLARALCSLVCGPLAVIVFGAAEDTLSFFLSSGGYPYFPGYMLTTITCLLYTSGITGMPERRPSHGPTAHRSVRLRSGGTDRRAGNAAADAL